MTRLRFEILSLSVVLSAALWGTLALAQVVDPAAPPPESVDLAALAKLASMIVDAVTKGRWWVVASGVVSLMTWGVRSGLLKRLPGAAGVFFATSPIAGYVLPFVLAGVGGLLTTGGGGGFTVASFLMEVLKIGLGAVGLFIAKKTVDESRTVGALSKTPLRLSPDPVGAALAEMDRKG